MNERITPFTDYPFDFNKPLSGQAMQAYRERVIEPLKEANDALVRRLIDELKETKDAKARK